MHLDVTNTPIRCVGKIGLPSSCVLASDFARDLYLAMLHAYTSRKVKINPAPNAIRVPWDTDDKRINVENR